VSNSQPVTPAIAAHLPVARLTLPSLHTVASQPVPGARQSTAHPPPRCPLPYALQLYTLPNSRAGGIALTMARRPEGHCRCCHDARSLSPCPAQALAHHARRRRPCRGRSPPAAPPRGEFRAPAPAAACRGATSARSSGAAATTRVDRRGCTSRVPTAHDAPVVTICLSLSSE
jgi:hypothetical protein